MLQILWMIAEDYNRAIKVRRANIRRERDTVVGVVLFGGGRS